MKNFKDIFRLLTLIALFSVFSNAVLAQVPTMTDQERMAAINKLNQQYQNQSLSKSDKITQAYKSNAAVKKELDEGLKKFNAQNKTNESMSSYIKGLAGNSDEYINQIVSGNISNVRNSQTQRYNSFNGYGASLFEKQYGEKHSGTTDCVPSCVGNEVCVSGRCMDKNHVEKTEKAIADRLAGENGQHSDSEITGCTGNYGLFGGLINTGKKIFEGLRDLIYVVAGFGIIGVAVGGFFGNLNWKWLGAIVIALVVIASTGELIVAITGCQQFTQNLITDTLK